MKVSPTVSGDAGKPFGFPCTRSSSQGNWKKKRHLRPFLFAGDVILPIGNPKEPTRKLLELINSARLQSTRSSHKNRMCSLSTSNEQWKSDLGKQFHLQRRGHVGFPHRAILPLCTHTLGGLQFNSILTLLTQLAQTPQGRSSRPPPASEANHK